VLLSGPTSLVLMEPPHAERSNMITTLWEEVVASSSMSDLAARLATFPIDTLPSFAAFFWTGDGMRSLVRGSVSIVDLASGVTVAQGEGIQTWSEVGLDQISQVQVETGAGESARLELPLVVGAVRASSVRLDASPEARVSSPQRAVEPDAAPAHTMPAESPPARREAADAEPVDRTPVGGAPVGGPLEAGAPMDGAQEAGAADAGAPVGGGALVGAAPVGALPASAEPEAGPAVGAEPEAGPSRAETEAAPSWAEAAAAPAGAEAEAPPPWAERQEPEPQPAADGYPDASDAGPRTELLADPFADDLVPVAAAEPAPEPGPTDPAAARRLAAEAEAELENADTTLMPPPFVPTVPLSPASPPMADNSLIMAVVCQYGHPSPQNATYCRTCGSPIAPQGPQLVPRPVLAVLRSSDGTTADVDRAVLIGRAPSGQRSSARAPRLMTLPSPGHDISRTHLEVVPEGWQVAITDLHSTNGTVLVHPDGTRQQLTPGEAVLVQLGSVVELGDGISVLIDFPQ
jgi:hypothetical protein